MRQSSKQPQHCLFQVCSNIKLGRTVLLAVQVVLKKSQNKDTVAKRVEDCIVEFANRGYRALGVAYSDGTDKVRHPCRPGHRCPAQHHQHSQLCSMSGSKLLLL